MRILLIAGGWSPEREISLAGAEAIEAALKNLGHVVTFLDLSSGFDKLLERARANEFAFINLHGQPGEDGLVQAMLDTVGCPYQGSGPAGSFLALNKAATKEILRSRGLPTPDWIFQPSMPPRDWKCPFQWPVFAKSNTGGSSLRLGRAKNEGELFRILQEIFATGDSAILEGEVQGKDVSCGVLIDAALPPILIEPVAAEFFDYESKYQTNGAREICPAPLPRSVIHEIERQALAAHNALGLNGVSRTDFIVDQFGRTNILEVNSLPGMAGTSLLRQEAAAAGLSLEDILGKLITCGLENQRQRNKFN